MRVIQASTRGLCFGVRAALDVAFERTDADEITIHGELVHNEQVIDRLRRHGYRMSSEQARRSPAAAATRKLMITAHGVSDRERRRLEERGHELVDTTCPLVRRVHEAALELERDGYDVVVIGKPGHVEVEGITGDLSREPVVVPDVGAVARWDSLRIGVVCQSTVMVAAAAAVVREIERRNPQAEVRFVDTICDPTKQRVDALRALLPRVDAVVVVGGRDSNNTRQLVDLCRRADVPVHHVGGAAELEPGWFRECEVVGLTAGTSTLDETIEEVQAALELMRSPDRDR